MLLAGFDAPEEFEQPVEDTSLSAAAAAAAAEREQSIVHHILCTHAYLGCREHPASLGDEVYDAWDG